MSIKLWTWILYFGIINSEAEWGVCCWLLPAPHPFTVRSKGFPFDKAHTAPKTALSFISTLTKAGHCLALPHPKTMNIGYARVSTEEQSLNLQIDALTAAGCDRIFRDDGVSATAKNRPQFKAAMNALQPGDRLVIWKLDRAFRSLLDALNILERLEQRDNVFHSLTEAIDTQTPMGRFAYQIIAAVGELERALIVERTRAGMRAAQQRGAQIGRPRKLSRPQIEWAMFELQLGIHTPAEIAAGLGVSERTLRRTLPKSVFLHPQPFFQQPFEEK